jgi:hypothetical protein
MGLLPQITSAAGGRLYVHDDFAPTGGGPLAFDSEGGFQGVVGGSGDGPGEFRTPAYIASDGEDVVLVYDRAHGLKVLTAAGEERARLPDIPYPRGGMAVVGDSLVVLGSPALRPADAADRELFAHDLRTGRLVSAFGPRTDLVPNAPGHVSFVAPSGPHGVWAVTGPSRAQRFELGGEHATAEIALPADWLIHVEGLELDVRADTGYVFHAVQEDGNTGVLWVLSVPRVPGAPNPFEASAPGAPLDLAALTVSSVVAYRRTVISAVDLESGEVVAHRVVDGLGLQFTPSGLLATMHEGADFSPEIRLWAFRLEDG